MINVIFLFRFVHFGHTDSACNWRVRWDDHDRSQDCDPGVISPHYPSGPHSNASRRDQAKTMCKIVDILAQWTTISTWQLSSAKIKLRISLRFPVSRFNRLKQQHAYSSKSTWILPQSTDTIFLFLSTNTADGLTSFHLRTRTLQLDASPTSLANFSFVVLALM